MDGRARGARPAPPPEPAAALSAGVMGQDAELLAIERFLDQVTEGRTTLVLDGDVGAGKTTLWRAAVAAAKARGFLVLACHPVESERALAFAALGDLLTATLRGGGYDLPAPQLRALRVAVLLEDPNGPPPDQLAVSVATLGLLRALSGSSAVLIAIDDYQWIDPASLRVLQFALRRLETERVGLLAATRIPDATLDAAGRGDAAAAATWRLTPAPLTSDALDSLFRSRLGASVPPPVLRQIAETSGGNPLFALEIARAIHAGEVQPRAGERLPVPATLEQIVRTRLAELPADVRDLLFLASAVVDPTIGLIQQAAVISGAASLLQVAVGAGVVQVDDVRIRFTHPLFASTIYHDVDPDRRRRFHRRLSMVVATPYERARQLSLAAEGPDAEVAMALGDAARMAAARGAPDAAADLSEQAFRLTPPGDQAAAQERRIQTAEYHFAAGDAGRARILLEDAVAGSVAGSDRADVLRRLARVRYRSDSCAIAADLLSRALADVGADDVSLRAGIERDLAWAVTLCGDVRDAAVHAESAFQMVEASGDHRLLPELIAARTLTDFLLGAGMDAESVGRAVELERTTAEVPIEWRPTMIHGMMLKWSGDLERARRKFEGLHQAVLESGDETSLPFLLSQLSETETWAGNWEAALRHAREGHALALQSGQEPIRATVLYAQALAQAHLGQVEEAQASAREGLELAESVGSVLSMMLNQSVLGFIELSLEAPASAHEWLHPLVVWLDVVGIREPGVVRFTPDEVEALVAIGQLDRADDVLSAFEAEARRLARPWALLAAARSRALHTAATGDASAAADLLEGALREFPTHELPFDRARALLVLGTVQRRTRRRRAARASLASALGLFEQLGAATWSARTGKLLGRERVADAAHPELTPAERRVADLVAAGATNRATADRLFVTVRTIEVHLTSIYRKLGVRSRTALAAKLAKEEASAGQNGATAAGGQ